MTRAGFYELAAEAPTRVALVDPSGERIEAGELLGRINRTARGLRELGLVPGDTLAVVLSNRREFVEAYGAAVQAGFYFVAINWHLQPAEVEYILMDSGSAAVITESRFAQAVSDASDRVGLAPGRRFSVDATPGMELLAELSATQSTDPPSEAPAGQMVFYTSGTTGRPKGVRKSFRAEASDEVVLTSGIGPIRQAARGGGTSPPTDLVYLSSGPLYHALPIAGVASALDDGGLVVMMDKWTPEGFLELVGEHRVTNATLVPTMFHRLLALPEEVRAQADVSSLRFVNHAGAPCPVDVKRRMIEWWGPIISEAYSSTEGAGTTVTSQEWLERPGTVGRPSPGVEIKIVGEDGNECPPGEPGLIYLTPALWEFEYHDDSNKTQASRIGDMFTVGDIGYLDEDGYLFLCGRQAETIISGGVNIYPAEVESVLLQHPAVRDVAVVGAPDEEWGEAVLAVVEPDVLADTGPTLESELIEFCRERIAHYKCPRSVEFVDSLDRDPNGKVRRGLIRSRYWPNEAGKS
jgi:long-chain acyl-CoA synthetase